MRRKTSEENPPQSRNKNPNAHILETKETAGFREGMKAYLQAWREANIQRAYIALKRQQFQKNGAPVRHPVLLRDILK